MNARLFEMFEELGVRLDGIYVCPHAPEEGCGCRKPRLGLVLQAASDLSFDPAQAIFIGDKESDIECGRRAGARAILIATSAVDYGRSTHAAVVAQDLHEAALAVVTA
jgi:histidinol-phosphate phosphatase family protein